MRTTQQDIADYLKISRLTVSKALNYASGVSEGDAEPDFEHGKTARIPSYFQSDRCRRLKSLREQGGKCDDVGFKTNLPFFKLKLYNGLLLGRLVISGMVRTLTKRGYNLNLRFLDLSEDTDFEFPIGVDPRTASGIIQLGNFKKHHIRRIRECGLPVVAVDTVEDAWAGRAFLRCYHGRK